MSAGSGIRHSEYNASNNKLLHLYQIWITPNELNIKPRYAQKKFELIDGYQTILSPTGENDSLKVYQDMTLIRLRLQAGEKSVYNIANKRNVWIQVVSGELHINNHQLTISDAAAISEETSVNIRAVSDIEILMFDLA